MNDIYIFYVLIHEPEITKTTTLNRNGHIHLRLIWQPPKNAILQPEKQLKVCLYSFNFIIKELWSLPSKP